MDSNLPIYFKESLAMLLPNVDTFSEEAIDNVRDTFICKVCNTVIQEIISAAKQQMASKKRFSLNSGCQPAPNASHTPC